MPQAGDTQVGWPRSRRPAQYADPREHAGIMAAIEAFKAGNRDHPFYLVVADQATGKQARKRMWRMARAEGYLLKTQVAQPDQKQGEWDVIYMVIGECPTPEGEDKKC